MTFNDIWEEIVRCTGNVITTKENTKFTYVVNENSIFIPKANWKITKSELEGAVKMLQNPSFAKNAAIGSSYVYAIIIKSWLCQEKCVSFLKIIKTLQIIL